MTEPDVYRGDIVRNELIQQYCSAVIDSASVNASETLTRAIPRARELTLVVCT